MTLLEVTDLSAGYGDALIVRGASMHVDPGEIVTIIGPNGCGKSTFLKALFGLATQYDGKVLHDDTDISGWRTDRLVARGIAYVPQVDNVFPSLTVRENMQMGGIRLSSSKLAVGIDRVCWTFPDLEPRISDLAATLSGGERQMLAISRALISNPSFLLLDEPTAALSPKYQQQIMGCIDSLREEGMTVLLVEQNARLSLARSDRGYIFSGGKVVRTGNAADILEDPKIGEYFLGVHQ